MGQISEQGKHNHSTEWEFSPKQIGAVDTGFLLSLIPPTQVSHDPNCSIAKSLADHRILIACKCTRNTGRYS